MLVYIIDNFSLSLVQLCSSLYILVVAVEFPNYWILSVEFLFTTIGHIFHFNCRNDNKILRHEEFVSQPRINRVMCTASSLIAF